MQAVIVFKPDNTNCDTITSSNGPVIALKHSASRSINPVQTMYLKNKTELFLVHFTNDKQLKNKSY